MELVVTPLSFPKREGGFWKRAVYIYTSMVSLVIVGPGCWYSVAKKEKKSNVRLDLLNNPKQGQGFYGEA